MPRIIVINGESIMPTHMAEAFFETAKNKKSNIALRHKVNGAWRDTSWEEYGKLVRQAARAFMTLGVELGGTVSIIGPNRPEWLIGAMGAIAAGAAPAGIYSTSTAEQVAYIAGHAESTVAIVHNPKQLAKFQGQRSELPKLKYFILMEGEPAGEGVMRWSDFLAKANDTSEEALDARMKSITPETTASLIYTSGTTGNPKAVIITHRNITFALEQFVKVLSFQDEVMLSYLPLSHIAEQNLSLHGPVATGGTVAFCEELEQLGDYLREVRPTIFFGVPRVWEKIQAKMVQAGAANPWLRKKIAAWARGVGMRANTARLTGDPFGHGLALPMEYNLARKLVFSKVRERLGLDRARLCISGAAAISKQTLDFFLSLDIPIYEVYGMSENCAVSTINYPGSVHLGTVGRKLPGIELRLAEDGEILTRGPHVFKGYLKNEEATKETIDEEGWLHTGDVGEFDTEGFLKITDRKKDLFKTSGGKYIAPQHLEGLLKGLPGVAHAVVIGEGRNYATALLTLDPESSVRAAKLCGATGATIQDLSKDSAFLGHIDTELQKINAQLPPYATIKKVKILPLELSIDTGELTPTMKLKRKVINQRFAAEIESLYN